MRKKAVIGLVFIICLLLVVNAAGHRKIKESRKDLLVTFTSPKSHIPAPLAIIMAGEFAGLVSDYLLLEAAAFIGSNQEISQNEWEAIYRTFKLALLLDPYFQQTYIYIQGNLAWEENMAEKTNSLLDISRKHRIWDWRPGYYMGFNYYYFLNDYLKASEMFLNASKIKDAPLLLALLGGRFAQKGKMISTAITLLESMLDDRELEQKDQKEIEDRIAVLKSILVLKKAINNYKEKYNIYPPSLETLVKDGFIDEMPYKPDYLTFTYENGQAGFE